MIDVCLCNVRVEVLALDKTEEELVDNLDMWPRNFQDGLVFFRVEGLTLRIHRRWYGAEKVLGEHLDNARVHGFGYNLPVVGNIVKQLVKCQSLDLLRFHIGAGIIEVEDDVALLDFLHEEVLPTIRRHLVEAGKFLELAMS